jgi:hypothetical protein
MSKTPNLLEDDWDAVCVNVTRSMTCFLRSYRTPVLEHRGNYGEGCGSGSYVQLGDRRVILTNQHVAAIRFQGRHLAHMFNEADNVYRILGSHYEIGWPIDLAVVPISPEAWSTQQHTSNSISLRQFASKHAPVEDELLAFVGFAGERVRFVFGQLVTEGTCYVAREVPLPQHDKIDPTFHFGIEFRPDLATSVIGTKGLPLPPGFSGSTVWNTGYMEARKNGVPWTPELAKVTGVVWGWPSGTTCIVATRVEYLHAFLHEIAKPMSPLY